MLQNIQWMLQSVADAVLIKHPIVFIYKRYEFWLEGLNIK